MANINQLIPLIFKWEGGYVNDPDDLGGPTNRGVTLETWQAHGQDINGDGRIDVEDLKLMTQEDAVSYILRPHYWNRWQADHICSQAIANLLVGWVWGSGKYGITIPQGILGVERDGIVGTKTLNAVNNYPDQEELFYKFWHGKRAYLNMICSDRPQNKKFLKGWLNRLNDYKWFPIVVLALLLGLSSCHSVKTQENRKEEFNFQTRLDSSRLENNTKETVLENVFLKITALEENGELRIWKKKYDLSAKPDSLTGQYPVSEETFIRQSDTKKQISLLSDTLSGMEKEYKHLESHVDFRSDEILREETVKTKESIPKWSYIIVFLLFGGGIMLVFFSKKL